MKTVTFYSYKGGVGRTLVLANFAEHLAANGYKVFVLDLDLEAPGIHYKLRLPALEELVILTVSYLIKGGLPHLAPVILQKYLKPVEEKELPRNLGVVNYLKYWYDLDAIPTNLDEYIYEYKKAKHLPLNTISIIWLLLRESKLVKSMAGLLFVRKFLTGPINVMPAGNSKARDYWVKLGRLDWYSIFRKRKGINMFRALKYQIQAHFSPDYLLIDARTGITPVGGVATTLMMPDSLVMLFNCNRENLDGVGRVAKEVAQAPRIDGQKPIEIFPVAVRLPAIHSEYDNSINAKIDNLFKKALQDLTKKINLYPSQVLHTDREVEVNEYLVVGNSRTNESSVLYKDYQNLFARLLGNTPPFKNTLLDVIDIKYDERMRRIINIFTSKEFLGSKPPSLKNLLKKIKIGEATSQPESPDRSRWNLGWNVEELGVKGWENQLPQSLKEGLKEFWVFLPKFLAYYDPDFLEVTLSNLREKAKYIYFLMDERDVTRLKTVAVEIANKMGKGGKEIVAKNLRYIFVTDNLLRAYLRHLNYWIANPGSDLPDSNPLNPPGFEVITEKGKVTGAVRLETVECQEIVNLVKHSLGDGKALEGFSALEQITSSEQKTLPPPPKLELSYKERMDRVLSILKSLKTDPQAPIPSHLLRKIEIGAQTSKPQSDPDSELDRPLWNLDWDGVKGWQSNLPKNLKSLGGLSEFWVLLPSFLPYYDPDFREVTGSNLRKGVKYLYFLMDQRDVTRLKKVAVEIANTLGEEGKEIVAKNLRYIFVTNSLFRSYLRNLNYWIANPRSDIQYSIQVGFSYPDNPQGFEVVTEQDKPIGAIPLKQIECQEIVKLVTYSLGDGKALEGFPVIE
ncbi:MAG TPA: hypothetical protein DCF68_19855 [Cyanothece sp. UBA12306]|nr:hypothetical protein [Cyanothece sp. UBA12306]